MAAVEAAAPVAAPAPEIVQEQPVEALSQGMEGLNVEQGQAPGQIESELHRVCAEGNMDGVRACLTASLEALETLDMTTGCTPIVLAIQNSHYDVVRELLSAGAIVPPPGLTNDPGMLSILYPPQMYGMPPFMQHMQGPPEFFPQSSGPQQHQQPMYAQQGPGGPGGFYPQERMYMGEAPGSFSHGQGHFQGQGHGHPGPRDRKGSRSEGQLPPMEVAKMIPCRNFPQCKYGNSCAFYHPNRPAFYGAPGGQYEPYPGAYQYGAGAGVQGGFAPQEGAGAGAQEVIPEAVNESAEGASAVGAEDAAPTAGEEQAGAQEQAQPFIPNGNTPFQPNQPAFVPMSNRRQSFNQFPGQPMMPMPMMPGMGPGRHGKKPSFSGGPRPFAPRGAGAPDLGKWKDGVPPPCVFFVQGKCRNGEMCKFPHIDADGNDCRNPDVIKGLIAPIAAGPRRAPRTSFGYPPAGPMGGHPHPHTHPASFDPAKRQQQLAFLQQQRAAVQNAAQTPSAPASGSATPAPGAAGEDASASQTGTPSTSDEAGTAIEDSQTLVASTSDLAAPAKVDNAASSAAPVESTIPTPAASAGLPAKPQPAAVAAPAVIRSASQPGMPRPAHARGPLPRRAGPGGPRSFGPGGNGAPNGSTNGRSASAEGQVRQNGPHAQGQGRGANGNGTSGAKAQAQAQAAKQRVPGADEFPSLGGAPASAQASPNPNTASWRTAAQVLSAPAPVKPVEEAKQEVKEVKETKTEAADEEITMDSDNESDGVIITCKPSSSNTAPVSGSASPVKKAAPLSFASIAGALGASGASTPAAAVDSAPVAVKA